MTSSYCSSTRESANLIVCVRDVDLSPFDKFTRNKRMPATLNSLIKHIDSISSTYEHFFNDERNTYAETYVSINDIYDIIDRVSR